MSVLMLLPLMTAALVCPKQGGTQPPQKQSDARVQVTVVIILASDRCTCVDPRLQELAAEVRKSEPKLTGFSLVSMTQASLAAGEKTKFNSVEDTSVEVVVRHCVDKNNQVSLVVKAPLQGEVEFKAACGKFMPIVTRYQAKEQVPPTWVAQAICLAATPGMMGPIQAVGTLIEGRCRARLIVAIRVQPCTGK